MVEKKIYYFDKEIMINIEKDNSMFAYFEKNSIINCAYLNLDKSLELFGIDSNMLHTNISYYFFICKKISDHDVITGDGFIKLKLRLLLDCRCLKNDVLKAVIEEFKKLGLQDYEFIFEFKDVLNKNKDFEYSLLLDSKIINDNDCLKQYFMFQEIIYDLLKINMDNQIHILKKYVASMNISNETNEFSHHIDRLYKLAKLVENYIFWWSIHSNKNQQSDRILSIKNINDKEIDSLSVELKEKITKIKEKFEKADDKYMKIFKGKNKLKIRYILFKILNINSGTTRLVRHNQLLHIEHIYPKSKKPNSHLWNLINMTLLEKGINEYIEDNMKKKYKFYINSEIVDNHNISLKNNCKNKTYELRGKTLVNLVIDTWYKNI